MADEGEPIGRPSPDHLSRRALLRRAGHGAVVAGLAVWAVPEVVVASPAGAQPLSGQPTGGGGGSDPGSDSGGGSPPGTSGKTGSSPSATGSTGAGSAGIVPATASGTGGGSRAFTEVDADALLGAGATLVAGGWMIHRWASRQTLPPESDPPAG